MNAIAMLEIQHRQVMGLFEQVERAKSTSKKKALFEQLADALAVHTTIEEKVFYPAAYASETAEVLQQAVEEHLSVKRLLVDLMVMTPGDEEFSAKMDVLKERVEEHVLEERTQLFPKVRNMYDIEKIERLGNQMLSLFTNEMKAGPSRNIADEIEEAPSLIG